MGFTGGNNFILKRLLKKSNSKLIFLLNIDTEISPDCFTHLVKSIKEDPNTGMVEALQIPKEHPKYYDPVTLETGWCSGGGVLIWKEALKEVGIFDDRFFLYCEDVDLSWRMWLKGWKCKINPLATYKHYTEDQDKDKDLSVQHYYSARNGFFMHYKYDSAKGIRAYEKLYQTTLDQMTDQKQKTIFIKARKDAHKAYLRFMIDRLCCSLRPHNEWILFNDFYYEKRRNFIDREDGKRIILPSGN